MPRSSSRNHRPLFVDRNPHGDLPNRLAMAGHDGGDDDAGNRG